jgi:hypothetical protein
VSAEIVLFHRRADILRQGEFAAKAAKNKCLAKSNKSRVQGKATNRHARHKNWQNADGSMTNAVEQRTNRAARCMG